MTYLLILGANGRIARLVRKDLLTDEADALLTEYLRKADRLPVLDPSRETIIEGDVNDYPRLLQAMQGQTMVLADLVGLLEPLAEKTFRSMNQTGVKRLIWITGLGLYH